MPSVTCWWLPQKQIQTLRPSVLHGIYANITLVWNLTMSLKHYMFKKSGLCCFLSQLMLRPRKFSYPPVTFTTPLAGIMAVMHGLLKHSCTSKLDCTILVYLLRIMQHLLTDWKWIFTRWKKLVILEWLGWFCQELHLNRKKLKSWNIFLWRLFF